MRSIILAGCAIAALAAVSSVPVKADQLVSGGVAITHGGGNVNVAKGRFSEADQAVTTLGGIASRHGRAITNGGDNRNIALGKNSFAGQDVTTVGGVASGRGRALTFGGAFVLTILSGIGIASGSGCFSTGFGCDCASPLESLASTFPVVTATSSFVDVESSRATGGSLTGMTLIDTAAIAVPPCPSLTV